MARKDRRDAPSIDPNLTRLSHTAAPSRLTTAWFHVHRYLPAAVAVQLRRSAQLIYSSRLREHHSLLLSYPKSGSTWLRNMLAVVIANGEVAPSELASWVPPLRSIGASAPATVLRSHDSVATPGIRRAGRIVILVRDPRAIAVSWSHHQQLRGATNYSILDAARTLVGSGLLDLGSWQSHAASALRQASSQINIFRYEDLAKDPVGQLREVCCHLRIDATEANISLAVELNDRIALRTRLIESGVEERSQPTSLVRSSHADSWRDECPAEVSELIAREAGKVMHQLGFTP